jgi:arabinogalactan oligomer/maltooligosaccharide transport system substrate-binding protein
MIGLRNAFAASFGLALFACAQEQPPAGAPPAEPPAAETPAAGGAAPPAGPGAALVVWHAYRGAEKAAFEQVVSDFNAARASAGISVKSLAVPYDAYADRITASVPRGKGPDVFIFAQDRLGGWVENGKIMEPIDFFVDDETRRLFLPGLLEAMTYRDTLYGLPLNYKSIAMFYNKALIGDPPRTSSELVQRAQALTSAASGKFGLVYTYNDYWYHAALMNAFGGALFGPGPTPTVDRAENVAAMKLMLKWYKEDRILPDDPSTALVTSLFNSGDAAIIFSGPWFVGEIAPGIDFAIATLPVLEEAGGTPMKPWMTVEGVYVSQGSAHKEAAYELARYLVSGEAALVLALEGTQLPSNAAVYEDPRVQAHPILSAFREQAHNAVAMPNYAEMTAMWSPVTTAMNKIVKGSATPEVALAEAQAQLTEAIAALRREH